MKRGLIVVPTYNEIETLPDLMRRIEAMLGLLPNLVSDIEAHVLVVDDSSPDGTGRWALAQREESNWLHVLVRPRKEGLGNAYRAAFRWAGERGYRYLIQMDADGSHDPAEVPRLLQRIQMPDSPTLVIASRRVRGSTQDWPLSRRLLSAVGNAYIRAALRLGVRDSTAGYRIYDLREILDTEDILSSSTAVGYGFQVETTALCKAGEQGIAEVPSRFSARVAGSSKMSLSIAWEQFRLVNTLALMFVTNGRK